MTRGELATLLSERGIPTEGQAAYHLLRRAGLEGVLCFGPDRDGEPTYVALADWAEVGGAMEMDAARAELARRYLAAFGPAGPEDLAAWSGLPVGAMRLGFEKIRDDLLEVDMAGTPAWMLKSRAAWLDEGKLHAPEYLLEGIENVGPAFCDLFAGRNFGKTIVKLL